MSKEFKRYQKEIAGRMLTVDIHVAIDDPSIATSSGLHSGSTDITRLLSVTSFL